MLSFTPIDYKLWSWAMFLNGTPYGGICLNYLLILFEGWGIFKISEGFSLTHSRTNFPFIMYLLFQISNPRLQYLSEGSAVALIMLPIIAMLFLTYQKPDATREGFIVGILSGMLFILWNKSLLYYPLIIIGFWNMRSLNLKTFLSTLLGLAAIFWMQFIYLFWTDQLGMFTEPFVDLFQFQLIQFESLPIGLIIHIAVIGLTTLIALIYLIVSNFQEKVRIQASYNLFILTFFFAIAGILVDSGNLPGHLTIFYITSAFLSANILTKVQTKATLVLFFIITGGLLSSYILNLWSN